MRVGINCIRQKKAAVTRYLATVEGKNFVLTNLVAEVANSYYVTSFGQPTLIKQYPSKKL
jgi:hypothetical protein